ncbi:MAG: NAD(P)H-dependent oxidoreductase subunit E [Candidatus Edwardsbacteria bacterium]
MFNKTKIDEIIEKNGGTQSGLVAMLQDIQQEYNYIPQETLVYLSEKLHLPLIHLYSLATFYRALRLTETGRHFINVCLGTACHVRGAPRILEEIQRKLNIMPGETTKDKMFTLETVNCLGACALGPIVVVDGEYYGQVSLRKVDTILKKYAKEEKPPEQPPPQQPEVPPLPPEKPAVPLLPIEEIPKKPKVKKEKPKAKKPKKKVTKKKPRVKKEKPKAKKVTKRPSPKKKRPKKRK